MKIFSYFTLSNIKKLIKKNIFFNKLFWVMFSLYRLINLFLSKSYYIYENLNAKLKKDKMLKLAFIAPVHSSHFINFKSTLDRKLFLKTKKNSLFINSYTSLGTFNFSKEHIIDWGLYNLFGYSQNSVKAKNWNKDLFLNADHNLNNLNIKFIYKRLKKFKPNLVWIHDLQSGGYLSDHFLSDLRKMLPNCIIVASVWGNDLYFFYEHKLHRKKLKSVLKNIDFLHVESPRDLEIAKILDFKGKFLPFSSIAMTNINEFEILRERSKKAQKDIFLCVKGSYFLRSNMSYFFDEISNNKSFWSNKKIVFIGTSEEDNFKIEKINTKLDMNIEYYPWMASNEYMNYLNRSKFHLICNLSDGILNSAAEAAFLDCLPIFSQDTGLCDFLDKKLLSNVTYNFNDVSFEEILHIFESDENLFEESLNKIREVYRSKVFSDEIYDNIFNTIEKEINLNK